MAEKKQARPGEPFSVTCTFENAPEQVFFAYVPPGARVPIVDPGSQHPDSKIEPVDVAGYSYQYEIPGCKKGELYYRMWSTDETLTDRVAIGAEESSAPLVPFSPTPQPQPMSTGYEALVPTRTIEHITIGVALGLALAAVLAIVGLIARGSK